MHGRAHIWILAVALCACAAAQVPNNLGAPLVAGEAIASKFGLWRAQADGPIAGTGQPETVTVGVTRFTLPDGTAFLPFAVGTPVAISGDQFPETVTPTAVSCSMGGPACTFQAVFAHPHAGHFTVSSGTYGLQEAINYQAGHGGGIVVVDAGFGGSVATLLPSLSLPSTVLMIDETKGVWAAYGLANGGEPQLLASFSSATGATISQQTAPSFASLNGIQFVSAHNFTPVAPGGTLASGVEATVTPVWVLPSGVVAGDSLYISGGTPGQAEVVTLTNVGTNCPGGTTASVCFTPAYSHSGDWKLSSATAGLQEAVNAAGAGGWVVDDVPLAQLVTPLVVTGPVRLTGFSAMDNSIGTTVKQLNANTDALQVGSAAAFVQDVIIENLMVEGENGNGSDSGVAIHCVNCAKLKLTNVTAKQAHDGVYFDSANGHAYDAAVTGCHFIDDYYGVHIVGGSANRLTFSGNTVDGNTYGVFDDGGWVHTWTGNDIEANSSYGYWQQVSNPASYSGHDVDFYGNYFEANGSAAGQGDLFLGQLVGGGSGNNGAGCENCVISGNLFNATAGGAVTALSLGAVDGEVSGNTYSGYAAGKTYAYITGPAPNYTHVLSLGDGADDTGATAASGAYGGARAGALTRIDANGGLVLGGWDQLNDQFGSPLLDTTIESPTGLVSVRGKPGGETSSNFAELALDGNSSTNKTAKIDWRNAHVTYWQELSDPFAANAQDFCLLFDYSSSQCVAYVNPQDKFLFGAQGPSGSLGSRTQDFQIKQDANGDSALVVNRATDSSPAGYLLDLEDSTLSTPLFRVDATGTITNGNWNNSNSNLTVGAISATGLTVGGNAVTPVRGQSGTILGDTYAAGQCDAAAVSFSSGVAVGMAVAINPETQPPDGLLWNGQITGTNSVRIKVCNVTSASIPWPAGSVFDVRVIP